jgi:hypothetical protein
MDRILEEKDVDHFSVGKGLYDINGVDKEGEPGEFTMRHFTCLFFILF